MPRHYHIPLFSLMILSCNNNTEQNIAAFRSLDETMTETNKIISRSTYGVYYEFQQLLYDPPTSEKAKLYFPKAKEIIKLSDSITAYIEETKRLLKKETGINNIDEETAAMWSNSNAVNRLFGSQGKGAELYKNLLQYRSDVLAVDSNLAKEFSDNLLLTTTAFDKQVDKDFTKRFYRIFQ